mgnify:CR=1 FL=1
MDRIVDKLKEYLDSNDISVSAAETAIGVSNGTLSKPIRNGTDIKTDTLEKFLNQYSDINPLWLFGSSSVMMADDIRHEPIVSEPGTVFKLRTDRSIDDQNIPLYDLEASAGLVELFTNHGDQTPIDTIHIPNLPKCDGAVFVAGDSMYPLLKSGDIVMYKKVEDIKNDIFWGHMYLISIAVNGEEYVMVKYIQRSDKNDDHVILVSENRHHQNKEIRIDKIRALALIKGSVRINTMN